MLTMYRDAKAIIRYHFEQEFPNGNLHKLEEVLSRYSSDDIIRFADMVSRFGLAGILDVVYEAGGLVKN